MPILGNNMGGWTQIYTSPQPTSCSSSKIRPQAPWALTHQNTSIFSIFFPRKFSFCYTDHTKFWKYMSVYSSLTLLRKPEVVLFHCDFFLSFQSICNTKHKKAALWLLEIYCTILSRLEHSISSGSSLLQKYCSIGISTIIINYSGDYFCLQTVILCKWQKEANKTTSRAPIL